MKSIVQESYGSPDGLILREIDKPVAGDDDILGKLLRLPQTKVRGSDLAGHVDAVGRNVTRFKPGDEVFGLRILTHGADGGAGQEAWPLLWRLLEALLRSSIGRQRVGTFMARGKHEDLVVLKELAEAGKLTPVIDRTYPLSETPDALRSVGRRGVRGKVVIQVA